MKKSLFVACALALCGVLGLSAAEISTLPGGKVLFSECTDWGKVEIEFDYCMANHLYTFSSVKLNGVEVNHTESDNIGPFLIEGRGWTGGNHLNGGRRSAFTESVKVKLDGKKLNLSKPKTKKGKLMEVEVVNQLLDPVDDSPFARETVVYTVAGNSIEVCARHLFQNEEPVTVARYYGMQSVFMGETEILTPGGAFGQWVSFAATNTGNELQFTKASAPHYSTFVERSAHGYQAAWMTSDGIGNRSMVDGDDVLFIGNSWTKSYHKLIGNKRIGKGDRIMWRGVYSWFDKPVEDSTCEADSAARKFVYGAYVNGRPVLRKL